MRARSLSAVGKDLARELPDLDAVKLWIIVHEADRALLRVAIRRTIGDVAANLSACVIQQKTAIQGHFSF
jgi:hypothetical protein